MMKDDSIHVNPTKASCKELGTKMVSSPVFVWTFSYEDVALFLRNQDLTLPNANCIKNRGASKVKNNWSKMRPKHRTIFGRDIFLSKL